jgi:Cofactor assembly of complex C subunit B, CCB2/CCB4
MDASLNRMFQFRLQNPGGYARVFFLLLSLLFCSAAFTPHPDPLGVRTKCHIEHRTTTNPSIGKRNRCSILKLAEDDVQRRRRSGVYVRPSAAIERGSGFFVPGLEGFKVRILVGCVVILLTIFNHWYDQRYIVAESGPSTSMSGNTFSECLAITYGMLVLLQGIIEARKESLSSSISPNDDTLPENVKLLQLQWSMENNDQYSEWRRHVEWAASTFLSLTPATSMLLIGPGKVIFSLGMLPRRAVSDEEEALGCSAALATVAQSTSGRVSLPMNHRSVQNLVASSVDNVTDIPRCAVLQRVDDQLCWLVTSDRLLVSFTAYDLHWLGQLAKYVNPAN